MTQLGSSYNAIRKPYMLGLAAFGVLPQTGRSGLIKRKRTVATRMGCTSDFRFRTRETDTFNNRVLRERDSQMTEDRRENISESRFRPIESINVNETIRLDSRQSVTETERVMERPNYSVNSGEISGVNSGVSVRRSIAMSGRSSLISRVMEPIYEKEFVGTQSYPYRSYSPIRSHAVCLCS